MTKPSPRQELLEADEGVPPSHAAAASQAVPVAVPLEGGRAELWMSLLLRAGTALALAWIVGGMVLTFARHPDYFGAQEAMVRTTTEEIPHRLGDVLQGLAEARGRAATMVGLLLLITLPVLRLLVAHLAFRSQGDRTYARISLLVLLLLALSFALGAAE